MTDYDSMCPICGDKIQKEDSIQHAIEEHDFRPFNKDWVIEGLDMADPDLAFEDTEMESVEGENQ